MSSEKPRIGLPVFSSNDTLTSKPIRSKDLEAVPLELQLQLIALVKSLPPRKP